MADAASAANRFGLGAMPGTLAGLHDPRGFLEQQVRAAPSNPSAFAGLASSSDYLAAEIDYQLDRRARKRERDAANAAGQPGRAADAEALKAVVGGFRKEFGPRLLAEATARWQVALNAPVGFDERIVRFWSNHFAVSVDKRQALLYAAPMEREVIRPRAFGRFEELLLGVESHPAMLRYLDNQGSIGPGSRFGLVFAEHAAIGSNRSTPVDHQRLDPQRLDPQRLDQIDPLHSQAGFSRRRGLNENLAREILELHTLGVNGGYTQADVTELARAITGWSVRSPRDSRLGAHFGAGGTPDPRTGFVYRDNAHEPGARSILGKRYPEGGIEQGRRVLADLAIHPATAKHLSFKLARHFVADEPPPKLVQRMAVAYLDSGGDLPTLYLAMLRSDEAWSIEARKFRTPEDFLLAALRALGTRELPDVRAVTGLLAKLGQPVFMPRSPAGFADTAESWIGPDALLKRIQVAGELSARAPRSLAPAQVAREALGQRLDADTAQAIARAESPQQGLSLLFASPRFQWRA
jgi:uncharacterized protein (DUF1800 family)